MGKEKENVASNVNKAAAAAGNAAPKAVKKGNAAAAGKKAAAKKEKKVSTTTAPLKPQEPLEETKDGDLESQIAGVAISEKLALAVSEMREPLGDRKVRIQEEVKELGWALKSVCEGYKFEGKGALFSEQDHFCSVEMHLSTKGPLLTEDLQSLHDAAKRDFEHVSGVCVSDGSHEFWGATHLKKTDLVSLVITGARKYAGGWILPTTLEIVHVRKIKDHVKIADIADNLDAKPDVVVLQLLDLFKQKKKIHDELASFDNLYLGRLRFLVSQFDMIDNTLNGAKFKEKNRRLPPQPHLRPRPRVVRQGPLHEDRQPRPPSSRQTRPQGHLPRLRQPHQTLLRTRSLRQGLRPRHELRRFH